MNRIVRSVIILVFITFHSLLFSQEAKQKGVTDVERPPIELSVAGNRVLYQNAPVGKKIEVYSVIGLKVGEIEVKAPSGDSVLNVPKGYYILKLEDTVRKVAVR